MKFFNIFIILFSCICFSQGRFNSAVEFISQGNYTSADVVCRHILKDNPNDLKALELRGDIKSYNREWYSAQLFYGRVKDLKPGVADFHYKYGGALGMLAQKNKICAFSLIKPMRLAFEKAITIEPRHIEARWALIEYYLQLPMLAGGSAEKALAYAEDLQKVSPIDGWLAKGRIAEHQKKYAAAESYYKKAISISSSKTSYLKLAGLYKNKMNQPEKAHATIAAYNQKFK